MLHERLRTAARTTIQCQRLLPQRTHPFSAGDNRPSGSSCSLLTASQPRYLFHPARYQCRPYPNAKLGHAVVTRRVMTSAAAGTSNKPNGKSRSSPASRPSAPPPPTIVRSLRRSLVRLGENARVVSYGMGWDGNDQRTD
nr:hypothetical protein CFP56_65926 [Quercus suber]